MATITKAELIDHLFENLGFNKQEGKALVETFFETICKTVETGESVKLARFGNFTVRDKKSRPGRNPKTGKPVDVTARRVVTFRAGQILKNRVNRHVKRKQEGEE